GAMSGVVEAIEGAVLDLTAIAPEIMVPLEILTAAIEGLADLFSTYVDQNKDMEKNLGKGGLFTQPGVGPGDAFRAMRDALNPPVLGQGMALGVTQERNLALAGAFAQGGYGITGGLSGPDTANMGPGASGQFMRGALG